MNRWLDDDRTDAVSSVHGTLLLVALTVLLALIVLLFLLQFLLPRFTTTLAPARFKIIAIIHTNEQGKLNFDSRVTFQNSCNEEYKNRDLAAQLYRNHQPVYASINTLHGHDFIPSAHNGVQYMGGNGCSEDFFSPGEIILIDFTDGTIHPGDLIELRVYERSDSAIQAPYQGNILDHTYQEEYLQEYVYHQRSGYNLISQDSVAA